MKVMERIVQQIPEGKMDAFREWQGKQDVISAPLGFPPLRWYSAIFTAEQSFTVVCEREWASMAELEAVYEKAMADPGYMSHQALWPSMGRSHRMEMWAVGL